MTSPLMRLDELAEYLRYHDTSNPRENARRWCQRHDVRMFKRGNHWLVSRTAVDFALEQHAKGGTVERARALAGRA